MKDRVLGKDLKVSPVGLGCMGMTHAYGAPADEKEMAKLLEKAVDMGYTFFDTAECYTGVRPDGTTAYNEELVGEALKPYWDKVVIATKCGVRHLGDRLEVDCSPQAIRKAVEGSLRRLQTDHIDLYYQHRMDPNVEPEVVADTMAQLMKEGKITHWGISEASEDYLRRAHAVCPVTAIQNRLSMMFRDYEALFPTLEELHVGFVAFSPWRTGCFPPATGIPPNLSIAPRTTAPPCPSSPKRAWRRTGTCWPLLRVQPGRKTPPQLKSPWRGCWRKSPTSCPSPAPGRRAASGKTWGRRKSP